MGGLPRPVLFGAVPIGALLGGVMGAEIGPRGAIWVTMLVGLMPAVLLLSSPIRGLRAYPSARAEPEQAIDSIAGISAA